MGPASVLARWTADAVIVGPFPPRGRSLWAYLKAYYHWRRAGIPDDRCPTYRDWSMAASTVPTDAQVRVVTDVAQPFLPPRPDGDPLLYISTIFHGPHKHYLLVTADPEDTWGYRIGDTRQAAGKSRYAWQPVAPFGADRHVWIGYLVPEGVPCEASS